MRLVRHPTTQVILEDPDCAACSDRGMIACPVLTFKGDLYMGHGKCECPVCKRWPEKMRRWAEKRGRLIPAAALDPKRLRGNWSYFPCPFCDEGFRFAEWLRTPRKLGDKGVEWRFEPAPARRVSADSDEGRAILEAYDARRNETVLQSG